MVAIRGVHPFIHVFSPFAFFVFFTLPPSIREDRATSHIRTSGCWRAIAAAAPGRWERRHRVCVEVPCHGSDNKLLLATGGDRGDVILATPGCVVAYNVTTSRVRQVNIDASRRDTVSPSAVVFRESLVWHPFFDARPHPSLPLFSFCS